MPIVALKDLKDFQAFAKAIAAGSAILLVLSFLQLLFEIRLVSSSYPQLPGRYAGFSIPDANHYAFQLLMPLLLVTSVLMDRFRRSNPLEWMVLPLGVLAIALTQSRMAYLSLTVGFVILLLLNLQSGRSWLVMFTIFAVVAIALFAFGLLDAFAPGSERLSTTNLEGRYSLYRTALEVVLASPWFGTLPGGWGTALLEGDWGYYTSGYLQGVHNMVLNIAVEFGIPMAVILLSALLGSGIYGLVVLSKTRQSVHAEGIGEILKIARGVVSLSVVFFVFGLTEVVPPDYVFMLFGISIAIRTYLRKSTMHGNIL
jgi:O-antigen ligase